MTEPSERWAIEEAWNCPRCSGDCASANPPVIFCPTEALIRKLDAEAYLDAVLMLMPEGWLVIHLSELGLAGGCVAKIGNPGTGLDRIADEGHTTMALALLAAIRAQDGGRGHAS